MEQLLYSAAPVVAAIAIVLFAMPSYFGLIRQQGFGRALLILLILGALLCGLLGLGIQLSLPFGDFSFADTLGYQLLGLVPWTMAFAYTPLVLAAFWLASKLTEGAGRILLAAVLLAAMNIVIDPALSFMGLRVWEAGGPFLGIPFINFAGWFITGLVAGLAVHAAWKDDDGAPVRRSIAYSGFAILWFWSGVNLGLKQWIPAAAGLVGGLLMLVIMYFEYRRAKKSGHSQRKTRKAST